MIINKFMQNLKENFLCVFCVATFVQWVTYVTRTPRQRNVGILTAENSWIFEVVDIIYEVDKK